MGNEARVKQEIGAAAKRFATAELSAEEIERTALNCMSIEAAHGLLQTNINQQFDQLLRDLGAKLLTSEEKQP